MGEGLLDFQQRAHWASLSICEGAIGASPEKLGPKEGRKNSCSVAPSDNRDLHGESLLSNLKMSFGYCKGIAK